MIRAMSFVVCLLAAAPVSALSCLEPSVERSYRSAAESPWDFVIAVGALRVDGPSVPPEGAVAFEGDINRMQGYMQPAAFAGEFFTGQGFDAERAVPIAVEVSCIAAWCGSFETVESGLFFLRADADGSYALEVGPCGGSVFADPNEHTLFLIVECHNGRC